MTNQEAIDIIKTAIAQVEWDYPMDYAAAFDMAVEALAKDNNVPGNGWISVRDRLPGKTERYMCLCYGFVTQSYWHELLWYENNHWWKSLATHDYDYAKHVTHWMPLPEPPKEDEHGSYRQAAHSDL